MEQRQRRGLDRRKVLRHGRPGLIATDEPGRAGLGPGSHPQRIADRRRNFWPQISRGTRRATAGVTPDLQVTDVRIFRGDGHGPEIAPYVLELARRFTIDELVFDPFRFAIKAQRLEADHGLLAIEFPQSEGCMGVAADRLHAAIVEERLEHPGHPELDAHVARAVAKATPRGWRLARAGRDDEIDAVIALAMAVDRAQQPAQGPARLVGWV